MHEKKERIGCHRTASHFRDIVYCGIVIVHFSTLFQFHHSSVSTIYAGVAVMVVVEAFKIIMTYT